MTVRQAREIVKNEFQGIRRWEDDEEKNLPQKIQPLIDAHDLHVIRIEYYWAIPNSTYHLMRISQNE